MTTLLDLPVVPYAIHHDESFISPELGLGAVAMARRDIQRISPYKEKGDVASFEKAKQYLLQHGLASPGDFRGYF